MKCPLCQSKTKIYNSRSSHQATQTWRRHRCLTCKKLFTTREKIDWNAQIVISSPDGDAPYSKERLLLSIARASSSIPLKPEMISELTDSVEHNLQLSGFFGEATSESSRIVTSVTRILHGYNAYMALQYINHVYKNKPPLELVKQLSS